MCVGSRPREPADVDASCTEDHLDDQPPRCLGDQRIKSTDDEYGTALVVYKAGDKRQLWSLHRV